MSKEVRPQEFVSNLGTDRLRSRDIQRTASASSISNHEGLLQLGEYARRVFMQVMAVFGP